MNTITLEDLHRDPADRVEAGESLLVACDGQPLAELRPLAPAAQGPRPFGLANGSFTVPDDFHALLPDDILKAFEGQ